MKKTILFILIATAAFAQNDLSNYRGKTSRQIANVTHLQRMDTTFFKTRIGDLGYALTRAFERRGLSPYDYSNNFKTLVYALHDSGYQVLIPTGVFTLSDSLYLGQPMLFQGLGRNTSRETLIDTTGPIINVQINNGQPAIIDTIPGMRLRDFALLADTSKNTGEGIRIRRDRQQTTVGNWHIDGVTIKDFKSHGIHVYAPDNNSVIMHNHVVSNRGWGLYAQASTGGASGKGLNLVTAFNRFLANDSGAVRLNSVAHTLWVGNGILGTQNSMPLIEVRGTRGRNQYDVWIANDIEGEAGGDGTAAPIFRYNNTKGTVWIANRVGQPEHSTSDTSSVSTPAPAFEGRGQVTSLLDIQNRYVGYGVTDTVMVARSGSTINYFGIGDRGTFFGKDIKSTGSGGYRYLDMHLNRDSLFAAIDAGSPSATFKGLYLNPYANSEVHFYARTASNKPNFVNWWSYANSSAKQDSVGRIGSVGGTGDFQVEALTGDLKFEAPDSMDIVFNDSSANDVNIRFETENQTATLWIDGIDDMVGIHTNNPKHRLSMYASSPTFAMTDTDVNTTRNSAAEASDSSAILLDASVASPLFRIRNSVSDTVIAITSDGGMIFGDGVTGLSQGAGTINAKGLFDDGVGVSDAEFAQHYGKELEPVKKSAAVKPYMNFEETRAFVQDSLHLPTMIGLKEWKKRGETISLGELTTQLWQTIERQHLHMTEMADKIAALEQKLKTLEAKQ